MFCGLFSKLDWRISPQNLGKCLTFHHYVVQDSFRHLLKGKDNRNLKLQIARHRGNVGLRLRYQEAENPTLDDVEIWVNRVLLDSLDAAYEKLGLPAVERKEMRTDILTWRSQNQRGTGLPRS